MFKYYILCFLISMVPLIELRGAILFAVGWGIMSSDNIWSILISYFICILGNMLPVPFIFLFARRFLEWGAVVKFSKEKSVVKINEIPKEDRIEFADSLENKNFFNKFCLVFLKKGSSAGKKLESKAGRGAFVALFLFVGVPLPGTGAWTGTLAASLLDMKFKDTVISVMLGVLLAGVIMLAGSLGVFEAFKALLS